MGVAEERGNVDVAKGRESGHDHRERGKVGMVTEKEGRWAWLQREKVGAVKEIGKVGVVKDRECDNYTLST